MDQDRGGRADRLPYLRPCASQRQDNRLTRGRISSLAGSEPEPKGSVITDCSRIASPSILCRTMQPGTSPEPITILGSMVARMVPQERDDDGESPERSLPYSREPFLRECRSGSGVRNLCLMTRSAGQLSECDAAPKPYTSGLALGGTA